MDASRHWPYMHLNSGCKYFGPFLLTKFIQVCWLLHLLPEALAEGEKLGRGGGLPCLLHFRNLQWWRLAFRASVHQHKCHCILNDTLMFSWNQPGHFGFIKPTLCILQAFSTSPSHWLLHGLKKHSLLFLKGMPWKGIAKLRIAKLPTNISWLLKTMVKNHSKSEVKWMWLCWLPQQDNDLQHCSKSTERHKYNVVMPVPILKFHHHWTFEV